MPLKKKVIIVILSQNIALMMAANVYCLLYKIPIIMHKVIMVFSVRRIKLVSVFRPDIRERENPKISGIQKRTFSSEILIFAISY